MSYEAYKDDTLGFTTKQLHAGYNPEEHFLSKSVPIYQTAAYELGGFDRGEKIYNNTMTGHTYARAVSPTSEVLQNRIRALEGGASALAFASGMAAIANTFLNLARSGDEIIAVRTLYGGSTALLGHILPQYGIVGRFVEDENNIESYRKLINDKTKAIFIESLGNPGINILDIEAIADLAHEYGIPVVIDNTFATPYLFRPFEHGADIVVYSATKYLGGHGTTIAGLVVEKGGFNWFNGRFPQFDEYYNENVDHMGEEVLKREIFTKRLRSLYLVEMGAHLSPTSAFYILQGMETLSLRLDRHVSNAQKVAEFLEKHPKVESVAYPGLKSSPFHKLSKKYFPKGPGAMMSIRIKGGKEEAKKFLESVRVFDFMVNVGDAKSMIVHPATSTHANLNEQEMKDAGIYDNTIRISVGIEDVEDLINDLSQALETI